MNIRITNNNELLDLYREHGLKLASPAKRLLVLLLEKANEDGVDEAVVYIHISLMPVSYSAVPAMLARTLAPKLSYLSIVARVEGEFIKITAADQKLPSTFRARAILALLDKGRFACRRAKVPKTYRERPNLLSHYITNEVDGKIATIAKRKFIIWKLTTTKE